ncbi:MAG: cell division protein FtsQ/DivIB [Burkholderiaceae bacterium]|jgi:cell division protein FtsQ|nr:cell division protein FtsQ/DivIB [Burkholderiaceae bacterium]
MKARDAMYFNRDAAPELALDVRLMNITSRWLLWIAGMLFFSMCVMWIARHPVFTITGIRVLGEVRHNNEVTLRANVVPRLQGSFFTVDLARAKAAFENVPWVRQAVVQREFPNRLRVEILEHEPVAYWGPEADSRLVNQQGQVFSANFGELDNENLPHLSGPDSESVRVLHMFKALGPVFAQMQLEMGALELTARGSWRARFKNGAQVELGRGNEQDVMARVQRLTQTLAQVSQRYGRQTQSLESADLRYVNGYALRLRGVSTWDSTAVR